MLCCPHLTYVVRAEVASSQRLRGGPSWNPFAHWRTLTQLEWEAHRELPPHELLSPRVQALAAVHRVWQFDAPGGGPSAFTARFVGSATNETWYQRSEAACIALNAVFVRYRHALEGAPVRLDFRHWPPPQQPVAGEVPHGGVAWAPNVDRYLAWEANKKLRGRQATARVHEDLVDVEDYELEDQRRDDMYETLSRVVELWLVADLQGARREDRNQATEVGRQRRLRWVLAFGWGVHHWDEVEAPPLVLARLSATAAALAETIHREPERLSSNGDPALRELHALRQVVRGFRIDGQVEAGGALQGETPEERFERLVRVAALAAVRTRSGGPGGCEHLREREDLLAWMQAGTLAPPGATAALSSCSSCAEWWTEQSIVRVATATAPLPPRRPWLAGLEDLAHSLRAQRMGLVAALAAAAIVLTVGLDRGDERVPLAEAGAYTFDVAATVERDGPDTLVLLPPIGGRIVVPARGARVHVSASNIVSHTSDDGQPRMGVWGVGRGGLLWTKEAEITPDGDQLGSAEVTFDVADDVQRVVIAVGRTHRPGAGITWEHPAGEPDGERTTVVVEVSP